MTLSGLSVPMHVVKDILGHSQINTTMRYAHLTEQPMRDATAEMDELLPEDQHEEEEKGEYILWLSTWLSTGQSPPSDRRVLAS
jgi:hypothetical protein